MPKIIKYQKQGKPAYKFQIYTGINPQTGKRSMTTRSGFRTKSAAKTEMKRIEAQVANDTFFDDTSTKDYTVQEVYELFHAGYKHTVRESTLIVVESQYRNHIKPAIGNKLIQSVTIKELQDLANSWKDLNSSFMIANLLKRLFRHAQKIGAIEKNPVDAIIFPKRKKKSNKKKFWSKQELKKFLEEAKNHKNPQVYPFFRLLAFCGIRKGEALALSWNDVDVANRQLKIHRNLSVGRNGSKITSTKTNTSRKISIDNDTLDALLQIKSDYSLVFHKLNGKPHNKSLPAYWMDDICRNIPVDKIVIHGLRHTHASLLFEAGASIKEVQHRLGHANTKMTMDIYTHVTKKSRDDFAEKFANFIDF